MIDLHVHSTCSDGTFTPTQLVEIAVRANLTAIALTDHDTVAGVDEILQAAKGTVLRIIPGIEISAQDAFDSEQEIHILGYRLDWHNGELLKRLQAVHDKRVERNVRLIQKMQQGGFDIDVEQIARRFPNTIVTRMHFARFLLEKGYVSGTSEAFERFLAPGRPYYVAKQEMSYEEAVNLILQAGGIPVLAHPNLYHKDEAEQELLVAKLKEVGLRGIEAIYSMNRSEQELLTRRLAKKYDLFITGGSDFHGANKPYIQMGVGRGNLAVPDEILRNLE